MPQGGDDGDLVARVLHRLEHRQQVLDGVGLPDERTAFDPVRDVRVLQGVLERPERGARGDDSAMSAYSTGRSSSTSSFGGSGWRRSRSSSATTSRTRHPSALARRRTSATSGAHAPDRHQAYLARQIIDRVARRRLHPTPGLSVLGALVATGAIAAAALSDGGDYREYVQPSGAMRPTVAVGQTVILGKELTPQRGDVVLVKTTSGVKTWESLGRVIGLSGDTVSCPPQQDGTCKAVVVSGRPLLEPWLEVPTEPFTPTAIGPKALFPGPGSRPGCGPRSATR